MTKREFFSGISGSWEDYYAGLGELERLRAFSGHFRLRPGERVLDAGGGCGRLIPVVCEQVGAEGTLVELDFASGMHEISRSKPHPANVTFVLGDAHSLPLPDGKFDKVIALALLPHLDDKAKALKEFRRVLNPRGMLVIAHQMGRDALDRLHGQSLDPVKRDRLPENAILESLLAEACFASVEILDEPGQYVAWARAKPCAQI
jgi:ubiquinone/menaquinone biosynthesis C-methylase UbiE